MRHYTRIKSGMLTVTTEQERVPLVGLLTYAARPNPKRGFYFVSKVLGRHIPVSPSVFSRPMERLAELVEDDTGPYLVVGLGEAAVGMGGAVAQHLRDRTKESVIYAFTTRQVMDDVPVLCTFNEIHSHAPGHTLYAPSDELAKDYYETVHLVLVDDEMTTGRTVTELAKKLCQHLPLLKKVTVLSLVSWVQSEQQYALAEEIPGVSFTFDALVSGTHSFEFKEGFTPMLPPRTDSEPSRFYPAANTGRRGIRVSDIDTRNWELPLLEPNKPVVVIGSVEFSFQPYLLAQKLEDNGYKVTMLCTTRTPILVGDAIRHRNVFDSVLGDPNSPIHYLYNAPGSENHQMVIAFENRQQMETYGLQDEIDLIPWIWDEATAPQTGDKPTGD